MRVGKCFAIWLDALAVKVASAAEGSRQVMVRSRFFSALPAAIGPFGGCNHRTNAAGGRSGRDTAWKGTREGGCRE